MGKISDIWVRLGLKKDDFDKGMDDAAKKTEGVGGAFGKMKTAALAVWAAVGTAVTKFAKDLIASTNRMGDAWAVFTSQSKAAWNTFLSALSSWDFSNFFSRMREATAQAAEFAKAMDMGFEVGNSIAIQRAAMAEELAALKIAMQDATKTYDERIKAAEDYLAKVKPLYDQMEAEAKRLEDAHFGNWLKGSGLGDTEQVRADLRKFLVAIGKNKEMYDQLAQYSEAQRTIDRDVNAFGSNYGKVVQAYKDRAAVAKAVASMREEYSTDIIELFRVYNDARGDKDTAPLVQAIIDVYNAQGLYSRETQEIQSVKNGMQAQVAAQAGKALEEAADDIRLEDVVGQLIDSVEDDLKQIEDIELEAPEIDLSAFDAAEERLAQFVDQWRAEQEKLAQYNQMIEDSIISSMGNGLQAITDMMFGLEGADMRGVLAAFIAPFGDMMKNLGALIMEGGIAASALKNLIKDPTVAIAAGAALMALGSMVSSGVQRMVSTGSGSGSVATTGASSAETETIKTELTVYVEGKISGKDIILAGNNTRNSWRR